ncbi:MAG: MFS transporter, partial [Rhodobacteraceae bacterium]|nr:MFS transporter [Paracoccaceae bacterium]
MPAEHTEKRPSQAREALAGLALAMLLGALGVSLANVALPALAAAFGRPFEQVQWVVLAYLLAVTVSSVAAGHLGDLFGHRRMLLAGLALFTLASAACGLAPSLALLIGARFLQGLGAAVMMALSIALVRETVVPARTGRVVGMLGSLSATGVRDLLPLFGPVAAGTAVLVALRWRMNVMSLPEEE